MRVLEKRVEEARGPTGYKKEGFRCWVTVVHERIRSIWESPVFEEYEQALRWMPHYRKVKEVSKASNKRNPHWRSHWRQS